MLAQSVLFLLPLACNLRLQATGIACLFGNGFYITLFAFTKCCLCCFAL